MKDLEKTIDKIISIDPTLKEDLVPIKRKFKRYPNRVIKYWDDLLKILNSRYPLGNEPLRNKIKKVLNNNNKKRRIRYTFDEITPVDNVIGTIPENIADKMRRHDRRRQSLTKLQIEAEMTKDIELMSQVTRKSALLEIEIEKIWIQIKDYFQLWDKQLIFSVRKKGPVLVIIAESHKQITRPPTLPGQNGITLIGGNQNQLKDFLRNLGLDLPPGLFGDEDENGN